MNNSRMIDVGELKWLAGFLEGEGSFIATGPRKGQLRVQANQVQLWPLERCVAIIGGNICKTTGRGKSQPQHLWHINGQRAAGAMMSLYILMSPRRQEQIRKALKAWRARPSACREKMRCPKGHPYSGPNLYRSPNGARECRICKDARQRRRVMLRNRGEGQISLLIHPLIAAGLGVKR